MSRRQSKDPLERYYTPWWVVRLCVDRVLPMVLGANPKSILEPCAGSGAFLMQLKNKFPQALIHANDIESFVYYDCDIGSCSDFLTNKTFDLPLSKFSLVVGNPPFSRAVEFVNRALDIGAENVVFLLRQTIEGSKERVEFWRTNKPAYIYSIPDRITFKGKGSDSAYHNFYVWKKGFKEETIFRFLPHTPLRERKG